LSWGTSTARRVDIDQRGATGGFGPRHAGKGVLCAVQEAKLREFNIGIDAVMDGHEAVIGGNDEGVVAIASVLRAD